MNVTTHKLIVIDEHTDLNALLPLNEHADDALAVAERFKGYHWELDLFAMLLDANEIGCTRSGYVFVRRRTALKFWQLQRFIDAGLIKDKSWRYSDPDSEFTKRNRFEASLDHFYPVTDLGRRVADAIAERADYIARHGDDS